ncbi:hypothetical protein EB821_00365 [Candidatus Marinimicrobia bacterium PRS2]|nr:hypothetical protein EB821_00365 [Candidatus Marinimicrobia bacterium PRS2]
MKFLPFVILLGSLLFPASADHLLLIHIVTQPDAAESFSIYNPTDSPIDLTNYYICDDEDYFTMQTEGDLSPSHIASGFTAQFPDININSEDTLTIVLNSSYDDFYGSDFIPGLLLYGTETNSMLETKIGSFGGASDKMNDNAEMIILFYWDGNPTSPIQDVDYFIWGSSQNAFDKSNLSGYQNDTPIEDQLYFEESADEYYAFSRIGIEETNELETGGNGITGHDETSENFRESWEVKEIFQMGCTDSDAPNFDPFAEFDDGSCLIPFIDVLNDLYDCNASSNGYCDSSPSCPIVKLRGMIVDYFDVTVYGGPHAITIEDEEGYRVEATIWPSEWDIAGDDTSNFLITPPFNKYLMEFQGSVFEYEGDKQILICGPEDFTVLKSFDQEGFFTKDDSAIVQISPAPFVLLPTFGETLDFSYSFPNKSRVIIRIYDLSGRFITSLVDKYYPNAGNVVREEDSSAWDGRDKLGQIVAPGTYILHMEVLNPVTGETQTDAAPVVVGVKN